MDIFTLVGKIAIAGMEEANQKMKGLEATFKANEKNIRTLGTVMTAVGAVVTAALIAATKAALDEEVGINKLDAALKNVGQSYTGLKDEIEAAIDATMRKTNYADDEQREALTQLVRITGSYEGALEQLQAATDLAAKNSMDLSSAAILVGRTAAGGTVELSRYGVVVAKDATATEKLAAMQKQLKGSAEAAANPLKILSNQVEDLAEKIGEQLVPFLKNVITRVTPVIDKIKEWITIHPKLTQAIIAGTAAMAAVATVLGTIMITIPMAMALFKALGVTINLSLGGIPIIVGLIVTAATYLILNWQKVVAFFKTAWENIKIYFLQGILKVIDGLKNLVGYLPGMNKMLDEARRKISGMIDSSEVTKEALETGRALQTLAGDIALISQTQKYTTEALQTAQKEYDEIKESSSGYKTEIREINSEIRDHEKELRRANDELKKQELAFTEAQKSVDGYQKAIDEVNRELDELSNPNLEGMQEFDNKLFEIDQKIKGLELQKLQSLEGTDTGYIDRQIEALNKQLEILELQKDIKFDPILRDAKESIETIKGLNEELVPEAVLNRIKELGDKVGPEGDLTKGYAKANEELEKAKGTFEAQKIKVQEIETELEGYHRRLTDIDDAVQDILDKKQAEIDNILEVQKTLDAMALDATTKLAEVQAQGDQSLDGFLSDITNSKALYDAIQSKSITITTYHNDIYNSQQASTPSSTGGSILPGMASGGWITEPTLLTRLKDFRPYAIAGEAGPERVSPLEKAQQMMTVIFEIDGKKVGKAIFPYMPGEARLKGGIRSI